MWWYTDLISTIYRLEKKVIKNKVSSMSKSLVGTDESTGAVIQKCSGNKVF